jgi:hypothetical protein
MRSLRPLVLLAAILLCGCGGTEPEPEPEPAPEPTTTTTPAPEPEPAIEQPAFMAIVEADRARAGESSNAYEHVEGLTDAAGPRLAGSPGDALAVAWAIARMNELGFANVHEEPVTVQAWTRGGARLSVIAPVPHDLPVAALGGSVGTPSEGIEGEVVRVESLEALGALAREAVEGRIVFVDQRMERARDGHGYGDGVGVRWGAASAAGVLGASAVIIRSVGTDESRFPHTGLMHYEDDGPRIPAAAISNADADVLTRWIAAGQTVRLGLRLDCTESGPAASANVVGEVVGTEHPDEIILLGAHLDSWDLGRGAVDDGAGVAIVMEAARQLLVSETPPTRTVRVVLFANEENGGAGAAAYLLAHGSELHRHRLAFEMDFGDGAVYGLRTPADPATSQAWGRLMTLLDPLSVTRDEGDPHGGADVGDLGEAGVPLLDLRQDGTRYFDLHHTANDVLTEVDRESLRQAAQVATVVASWASRDPDL